MLLCYMTLGHSSLPGLQFLICQEADDNLYRLRQGFRKRLVSDNTERRKALGKSTAQEGVLIKGSVHTLIWNQKPRRQAQVPLGLLLTSRGPSKLWVLSSGDLSASSARLYFQT